MHPAILLIKVLLLFMKNNNIVIHDQNGIKIYKILNNINLLKIISGWNIAKIVYVVVFLYGLDRIKTFLNIKYLVYNTKNTILNSSLSHIVLSHIK